VAIEDAMQRLPPSIELAQAPLVTKDAHLVLKATATDPDRLLDGYIFVGARKLFYRSNRNGADPKRMGFEADLPLRPGVNVITVVARENPDTVGRKTIIVRRDGPNGELLSTPRTDDEELGGGGGGGDD
jgi:carboxyl-terminal processing protease